MNWRATAMILGAFLVAWLANWGGPLLLDISGLSEFAILGQMCFVVVALSVLERVFARL